MLQSSVEQSMEISKQLVQVLMVKNKLQGYDVPMSFELDITDQSLLYHSSNMRIDSNH